jgi:hypothetical protein
MIDWLGGPAILAIIGAFISAFAGIVRSHSKEEQRSLRRASTVFLVVGPVLTLVGGIWSQVRHNADQAELNKRYDKQLEAQAQLLSKTNEVVELTRTLAAKSDEIARLNRELRESMTGGDSFAYVAPTEASGESKVLTIVQMGRSPLYDVAARVVDLAREPKPEDIKNGVLNAEQAKSLMGVSYGPFNLPANMALTGAIPPIGLTGRYVAINVFFTARNGSWSESLRFKRVDGQWRSAIEVVRDPADPTRPSPRRARILLTRVDPKFPRNRRGEPIWSDE